MAREYRLLITGGGPADLGKSEHNSIYQGVRSHIARLLIERDTANDGDVVLLTTLREGVEYAAVTEARVLDIPLRVFVGDSTGVPSVLSLGDCDSTVTFASRKPEPFPHFTTFLACQHATESYIYGDITKGYCQQLAKMMMRAGRPWTDVHPTSMAECRHNYPKF